MSMEEYRTYLEETPQYFQEAVSSSVPGLDADRVLVCGMGGSGITGLIAEALEPGKTVAYRGYNPSLRDVDAAICISYSGNTDETLSCYDTAKKTDLPVVAVTSGGILQQRAEENGDNIVEVPDGLPPRAALPYLLTPVLRILNENYRSGIEQVAAQLIEKQDTLRAMGERLAEEIQGKTPLLYAPESLYPAAYRFKTQVNENAKQHAFTHVLPEAFHNEIVGYEAGEENVFPVFLLRKGFKKVDRMAQLVDVPNEILRVDAPLLDALLEYIYMGDWCSLFLAERNGVDPVPVDIITELKAVGDA